MTPEEVHGILINSGLDLDHELLKPCFMLRSYVRERPTDHRPTDHAIKRYALMDIMSLWRNARITLTTEHVRRLNEEV